MALFLVGRFGGHSFGQFVARHPSFDIASGDIARLGTLVEHLCNTTIICIECAGVLGCCPGWLAGRGLFSFGTLCLCPPKHLAA